VIIPEDDLPLHQAPVPLTETMAGHPNAYDRFWLSGYSESWFFALGLGLYPNRGVIDAAFCLSRGGVQHSVFTSDRLRGRPTEVGPIRVEIITPMVENRVVVTSPEHGIEADLTYRARFPAIEERRQTLRDGSRVLLDVTRATQLGTWTGTITTADGTLDVDGARGTKDRSWGVRPVGEPLPGAPSESLPQVCFLWAPLHFIDSGAQFMSFDDAGGRPISRSACWVGPDGPTDVTGRLSGTCISGTRQPATPTLHFDESEITLEPLVTFHMRGAGYGHPTYAHGRWHGGAMTESETLAVADLNPMEMANLHIEQVVRATGPRGVGLGTLESLIVGPSPSLGLSGLLDPA
jgi:hypothetical protein